MKRLRFIPILAAFILILAILVLAVGFFTKTHLSSANINQLRCEYLLNPMGIGATNPRLSWIITSDRRGERQTAYQILVASSTKLLGQDKGDLWNTGQVRSDQTVPIAYRGQ